MICPQCGAENSDSAQFCNLCAAKLEPLLRETGGGAPGERRRVAAGEWRGDEELLRTAPSKAAQKKMAVFRVKVAVVAVLVAAAVAWVVLSLTVWANPTPSKVSSRLIEALNERRRADFTALFPEEERASAGLMYDEITEALGAEGRYREVKFRVEKPDNYTAYCHLEGGSVILSGGSAVNIQPSQKLVVYLENHGGKWYAKTWQTSLVP